MSVSISPERVAHCYQVAREALLAERAPSKCWEGELSTSALSTATAVTALEMVRRNQSGDGTAGSAADPAVGSVSSSSTPSAPSQASLEARIAGGLAWLADHQNDDGGWGDTTKSVSNISTTMLAHAVFHAAAKIDQYPTTVKRAADYIERAGGIGALFARYGKDRTFSVPILTHCALAGVADWSDVIPLPFELACIPARFYKTVRLPVVSYALPALIAIGQVRHFHQRSRNPLARFVRDRAIVPSLNVLERIQPSNGGFLEATPLTSFVTMSLAAMGLTDHPVVRKGVQFILDSVRPDGSWPIDTNLATWGTTLSVNALGDDLPVEAQEPIRTWLLDQQYREIHPYTNADPGGWAWTNLPGGVPDADDTPGAILALLNLRRSARAADVPESEHSALQNGIGWLLDLQNRDGGWPTFCRGWGALPFDRSAADITAHAVRALRAWLVHPASQTSTNRVQNRVQAAIVRGFRYLSRVQRQDGAWLPLWFGNQFAPDDENPTYGTARVLAAYRDLDRLNCPEAQRGLEWLRRHQNADGGWGGGLGLDSTNEETALAVEILLAAAPRDEATWHGVSWLLNAVESGTFHEPTPIGFYFAKLWYFEKLYPLTFCVAALSCAHRVVRGLKKIDGSLTDQEFVTQHTVPE